MTNKNSIEAMIETIDLELKSVIPHDRFDTLSFLMGFEAACETYAVYNNGDQILGCGPGTLREMKAAIRKYTEQQK